MCMLVFIMLGGLTNTKGIPFSAAALVLWRYDAPYPQMKNENPWLCLHHPGIDVYVSAYSSGAHQDKRYPMMNGDRCFLAIKDRFCDRLDK